MFALGRDLETGSLQSSNGSKMIDTRYLWHEGLHRYFDFANLRTL
jgi:hypothetical protein